MFQSVRLRDNDVARPDIRVIPAKHKLLSLNKPPGHYQATNHRHRCAQSCCRRRKWQRLLGHCYAWQRTERAQILRQEQIPGDASKPVCSILLRHARRTATVPLPIPLALH